MSKYPSDLVNRADIDVVQAKRPWANTPLKEYVISTPSPAVLAVLTIVKGHCTIREEGSKSDPTLHHSLKILSDHSQFDNRKGATWHCIVGRNFGSFVTHGRFNCLPTW